MPAQARLGDPTSHGGTIITSSNNTYTDSRGVARIGDIVTCPIHGNNPIIGGSSGTTTNSRKDARIGDATACGSTIVGGSQKRFVENSAVQVSGPLPAISGFQPGVTAHDAAVGMVEEPGALTPGLRKLQNEGGVMEVPMPIPAPDTAVPAPEASPVTSRDCTSIHALNEFPASFQLTPSFTLGQVSSATLLQRSPPVAQMGLTLQQIVCNLKDAATNLLEPIKAKYPGMMITSGFRPAALGKATSNHVFGAAFDIQWSGISDQEYYSRICWIRDTLQWTELILEFGGNRPWIHCAYRAGNPLRTKMLTRVGVKPDSYATGLIACTNIPGVGGTKT